MIKHPERSTSISILFESYNIVLPMYFSDHDDHRRVEDSATFATFTSRTSGGPVLRIRSGGATAPHAHVHAGRSLAGLHFLRISICRTQDARGAHWLAGYVSQ